MEKRKRAFLKNNLPDCKTSRVKKDSFKSKISKKDFSAFEISLFLIRHFKKEETTMPRTRKTYEEQLESNENEIQKHLNKVKELKEQQKGIRRRKRKADRNARTKRLVEIGAVAEKVLGREFKEGDNERFMKFLNRQEYNGKFYSRAMNEQSESDPSESPAGQEEPEIPKIFPTEQAGQ